MTTWPKLYLTDIIRFYDTVLNKCDLIQRIQCENLNGNSKFCLFRTKCVPSQRIAVRQYDVWAIARKDSIETVGDEIINAYCKCTAGFLGTCNHIASLFRIEAAFLLGHTHQTCTSQLSQWNIPSHKKQIEPVEVASFIFEKETYMKKAT